MSGLNQMGLQKLHTDQGSLPPHHTARTARFIKIEDEVKGPWDRAVSLYLGPFFRIIANDALDGSAPGAAQNNARVAVAIKH